MHVPFRTKYIDDAGRWGFHKLLEVRYLPRDRSIWEAIWDRAGPEYSRRDRWEIPFSGKMPLGLEFPCLDCVRTGLSTKKEEEKRGGWGCFLRSLMTYGWLTPQAAHCKCSSCPGWLIKPRTWLGRGTWPVVWLRLGADLR